MGKRFEEAARIFERGDVVQALERFTALSHDSDSPNVALYLGYCEQKLGRLRDAYKSFALSAKRAAQSGDDRYRPTLLAAQDQISVLGLQLAKLTVSLVETPPGLAVRVDDEVVAPGDLGSPIVVEQGSHHIQAVADGYDPIHREVQLNRGDNKTVTLILAKQGKDLTSPAADSRGKDASSASSNASRWTTLGIVAGGATVLGLGTFALAGLRARSIDQQLDSECGGRCSDATHRSLADDGKTYQLVANVGLAVGVVGALSAATFVYLGATGKSSMTTQVGVAPNQAGVSLQGRF